VRLLIFQNIEKIWEMRNHNYKKQKDYQQAKERDRRFKMNKKELIEAIKEFPDNYKVTIFCGFDARDPTGPHEVVSVKEHKVQETIELVIAED
jgi:hypothetical protein